MPCSKGSGPIAYPKLVRLIVYLVGPRTLSCVYTRNQAALRLKWARHLEAFKGHRTEAA